MVKANTIIEYSNSNSQCPRSLAWDLLANCGVRYHSAPPWLVGHEHVFQEHESHLRPLEEEEAVS